MTAMMRYGAWAAGALALLLTMLFGPVIAAAVFVAAAFALMGVLMGMQVVKAISDWRLDHPWKPRRTKRV